jgi:hypothetical protein
MRWDDIRNPDATAAAVTEILTPEGSPSAVADGTIDKCTAKGETRARCIGLHVAVPFSGTHQHYCTHPKGCAPEWSDRPDLECPHRKADWTKGRVIRTPATRRHAIYRAAAVRRWIEKTARRAAIRRDLPGAVSRALQSDDWTEVDKAPERKAWENHDPRRRSNTNEWRMEAQRILARAIDEAAQAERPWKRAKDVDA